MNGDETRDKFPRERERERNGKQMFWEKKNSTAEEKQMAKMMSLSLPNDEKYWHLQRFKIHHSCI